MVLDRPQSYGDPGDPAVNSVAVTDPAVMFYLVALEVTVIPLLATSLSLIQLPGGAWLPSKGCNNVGASDPVGSDYVVGRCP